MRDRIIFFNQTMVRFFELAVNRRGARIDNAFDLEFLCCFKDVRHRMIAVIDHGGAFVAWRMRRVKNMGRGFLVAKVWKDAASVTSMSDSRS